MLAFFRGLLVFLLGAVVGAVGILLFLPTFSVTLSNHPHNRPVAAAKVEPAKVVAPAEPAKPAEPIKPAEPVAKVEDKPAEPVAKTEDKPAEPAKVEEPVAKAPMKEAAAEPAKPAEPVAKTEDKPAEPAKPAKSATEEKIDFTLLNGRPVFWPAAVAVTTATSTPLIEKGVKVADIPLDVGTTLQVSKVLGDGALLVRAQGLQFEIDHRLTDFDAVVRKKIQEVIDAGGKIPPPFKSAPVYVAPIAPIPVIPAPAPKPAAVTPAPATGGASASPATKPSPTRPSGGSLDDKMNSLFGRRMSEEEKADAKAADKKKTPAK